MKRPHLVIAVNIIQLLLTLLVAGTSVYVLFLTRSPETLKEPDAADTIHGLIIGAAVLGVPALFLITALWGLWRNKRWGWWLALVTDVVIVATLVYSMIGENSSDLTEPVWTLCFVVCAILLLLPKVRRFYWETRDSGSAAAIRELET
jgi:uncharacterized membrane protein (DUF2068 family)